MRNWPLWRTLALFFACMLAVHALIILFHLMMMAEWPVGRVLRRFYYSHSPPNGVKETWPLIDYYLPMMLLVVVTVRVLLYRSIFIHLTGWILCCISIVGPMPLYATRLVPTPVSTWGSPYPPPFERLPENSPFLLMMSIFSVLARYAAKSEDTLREVPEVPKYPDRNGLETLALPADVELFDQARVILSEYGGLEFGDVNEKTWMLPNLEPGVIQEMKALSPIVGRNLYPLGYREHQDREYFFTDEEGVIYLLADDELRPFGCSFADALVQMISKRANRRVRKRLEAQSLLGERWCLRKDH